jgi:hypothetical protein
MNLRVGLSYSLLTGSQCGNLYMGTKCVIGRQMSTSEVEYHSRTDILALLSKARKPNGDFSCVI